MCNTMYEDLKARYPQYGATDKILAFSNFLHPGLKGSILFKIGLYNTTLELLRLEEEGTPEEVGLDQAMALDSDDEEQQLINACSQGMASTSVLGSESPMQREINQYRAMPLVTKNVDVLNFWKENAKTFPLLVKVVRKYFCIQSTSTSSERTFSTGGAVVTAKRNKLDPVNVNMLVYLKENLGKVQLERLIVEDPIEEEEEKKIMTLLNQMTD